MLLLDKLWAVEEELGAGSVVVAAAEWEEVPEFEDEEEVVWSLNSVSVTECRSYKPAVSIYTIHPGLFV